MALYLSYNHKKGLVKQENTAYGCYIQEHDEAGWESPLHEQILEIPEHNMKIIVRTNLHYGSRSFMNARISMMDKPVLNFIDNSLCHSVEIVYAKPGDWNSLFDNIILLYNSIYSCEKYVNSYFDTLDEAIKGTNVKVDNDLNNAIVRLSGITSILKDSIYGDSIILDQRIKKTCHLLVRRIMDLRYDSTNPKPWAKELQCIFNYLGEREELVDAIAGM